MTISDRHLTSLVKVRVIIEYVVKYIAKAYIMYVDDVCLYSVVMYVLLLCTGGQ